MSEVNERERVSQHGLLGTLAVFFIILIENRMFGGVDLLAWHPDSLGNPLDREDKVNKKYICNVNSSS